MVAVVSYAGAAFAVSGAVISAGTGAGIVAVSVHNLSFSGTFACRLHLGFYHGSVLFSIESGYYFHAGINAQSSAVQGDIVVLCASPFEVGVESAVSRTSFILFFEALFGRGVAFAVDFHDAFGAEARVRMDEHFQAVCRVAQDIIGAPSDYNTRTFFGKLCDCLVLDFPKIIFVVRSEGPV